MANRVLVTGKRGQLATAIANERPGDLDIHCVGRPELDLTSPASIDAVLDDVKPQLVLNTAAYTNVDGAEKAAEHCFDVNANGVAHLARAAARRGMVLVHISTDCVFDGTGEHAYREDDIARPLSVYGASKLAGEEAVGEFVSHHLIIRVSWVFSRFGSSFPRTMLRLAKENEHLSVVCDQTGCPTHAQDLAAGLLSISAAALRPGFAEWGVYHLAGTGETDRASMATAIFDDSRSFGGPTARVEPVETAAYHTPARRPLNARLDSGKAADVFGVRLPHWRQRLRDCVRELVMHGDGL